MWGSRDMRLPNLVNFMHFLHFSDLASWGRSGVGGARAGLAVDTHGACTGAPRPWVSYSVALYHWYPLQSV